MNNSGITHSGGICGNKNPASQPLVQTSDCTRGRRHKTFALALTFALCLHDATTTTVTQYYTVEKKILYGLTPVLKSHTGLGESDPNSEVTLI